MTRRRNHELYSTWNSIRGRCQRPTNPDFVYYGARGITVCSEWEDFWVFVKDVGQRPNNGWSLDRIDNDKGYEPSNVRWATKISQARNRRPNGTAISTELRDTMTTCMTTIRFSDDLFRAVEREAQRTERTVSAIVRLALAEWIAAQRQHTQRSA
jgi:hypothetical protein